jgi:hypothetical protein
MPQLGQALAIGSCIAAAGLYVVMLFFNPYAQTPGPMDPPRNPAVPTIMLLLQFAGSVAAASRSVTIAYLLFVAMFFPVGWYTTILPTFFRWIGFSNLAFLLGIVLIHVAAVVEKRRLQQVEP